MGLQVPALTCSQGELELAEGSEKHFVPRGRDLTGRVLAGRYELLSPEPWRAEDFQGQSRLGQGSFGEAWRALDRRSGDSVVIKLFLREGAYITGSEGRSEWWRAKAEQECSVVQRMLAGGNGSYPQGRSRLCACLESHVRDRRRGEPIFLVLEDCGESLVKSLARREYSLAEVRSWMQQVLMGLAFMAGLERPVAHKDVALRNVVNGSDGAKLIDFGLAGVKAPGSSAWAEDLTGWAECFATLLCRGSSQGCLGTDEDWRLVEEARAAQTPVRQLLQQMQQGAAA